MKHVSILIPKGHISLSNVEGTWQILSMVNTFLEASGKAPAFDIHLVGLDKSSTIANGLFKIVPDSYIDQVAHTDLIIIPALQQHQPTAIANNRELLPWIITRYEKGSEVVAYCVASFLLAATGLLDGRSCTTHWLHAHEFRRMFPQVNLLDDKIMTAENGIYTSGGAYSYLNLLLYLVEKYTSREMAIRISKTFMIDFNKASQSPFIIFNGQKEHGDETIMEAQAYIERHYNDKLSIDLLADELAIGRRSLERRFKKATGNTIAEYIQRVKVEAAKKSFEVSRKNINEVMYEVGYSDTKAFRTVFRNITGLSPLEYRNRYNKLAVAV